MVRDPDAGTDDAARTPSLAPEQSSDDVSGRKATDVLADGDPDHTPSVDDLIADLDRGLDALHAPVAATSLPSAPAAQIA